MKTKILTALALLAVLTTTTPAVAAEDKSLDVVMDLGLARPGCFAATVAGSAIFVLALPFAAMSHSVKKTAHTLVGVPAHATFTRPVGDFTSLEE
jgi:hypothetical protein